MIGLPVNCNGNQVCWSCNCVHIPSCDFCVLVGNVEEVLVVVVGKTVVDVVDVVVVGVVVVSVVVEVVVVGANFCVVVVMIPAEAEAATIGSISCQLWNLKPVFPCNES